jgi:hypothetical protein
MKSYPVSYIFGSKRKPNCKCWRCKVNRFRKFLGNLPMVGWLLRK